jgi:hypothetical protein
MRGAGSNHGLSRGIADFVLAFVLFWGASLYLGVAHSPAHASLLPAAKSATLPPQTLPAAPTTYRIDQPRQAEFRHYKATESPQHARLLLSLALAGIVALNLGFWRHLRRVYASPRRGVWRRG